MHPPSSSPPDPLFGWRTAEEDISFDRNVDTIDIDNDSNPTDQILGAVGGILDHAEGALEELISATDEQGNNVLGTAIFRGCRELANAVGQMATELEQQSPEDRRALADACYQDVVMAQQHQEQQLENLLLTQTQRQTNTNNDNTLVTEQPQNTDLSTQVSSDDILSALSGASTLLRDVEVGLRGMEQDEAEEIADVALTLARLFLASLQSVHSSIVDQHEEQQHEEQQRTANRFEIIEEESDGETRGTKDSENKQRQNPSSQRKRKLRNDRLRVLWPPLGPAVATVCDWGKEEATKRPLLAVTLGMTLWPAAVLTALIGTPLVLVDPLVQHTYETFQEGPIVSNVEKAAAQAFQAGKLSLVCGKLVGRQSLRVLNRQIDRQGGMGAITQNVGGMVVDRALHPVETVGALWDGLQWGWQLVQSNLHHLNFDHHGQDAENASSSDEWD